MNLDQATIEALDPGIKQFVIALNEAGFTTTDSGDGTFKFQPGSEYDPIEVIPFPHVIARMEFERNTRAIQVRDAAYQIKDLLQSIEPKMEWRVELVWDTDSFDADDEGWLFMALADGKVDF